MSGIFLLRITAASYRSQISVGLSILVALVGVRLLDAWFAAGEESFTQGSALLRVAGVAGQAGIKCRELIWALLLSDLHAG